MIAVTVQESNRQQAYQLLRHLNVQYRVIEKSRSILNVNVGYPMWSDSKCHNMYMIMNCQTK